MSNAECPCQMLNVHVKCCMSIFILQVNVHSADPYPCCIHIYVHAACPCRCCLFMLMLYVHATFPCPCYMSMTPCYMSMAPCYMSMLHIRAARPSCIFVLHVMLHARSRNCEVKNKSKTITVNSTTGIIWRS
jgi:hypothetical protein